MRPFHRSVHDLSLIMGILIAIICALTLLLHGVRPESQIFTSPRDLWVLAGVIIFVSYSVIGFLFSSVTKTVDAGLAQRFRSILRRRNLMSPLPTAESYGTRGSQLSWICRRMLLSSIHQAAARSY